MNDIWLKRFYLFFASFIVVSVVVYQISGIIDGGKSKDYTAVLSDEITTSANTGSESTSSYSPTPTYYNQDYFYPTYYLTSTPTPSPYPTYSESTGGYNYNYNYSPTPSPFPTPTYYYQYYDNSGSGSYSTTYYSSDRLAQVDSVTLACISTVLTQAEIDKLRHFTPKTSVEEEDMKKLMDRVSVCFEGYQEAVKISEGGDKISGLSAGLQQCLIMVLGEGVYEEINSGRRPPAAYEKQKSEACFSKEYNTQIRYQSKDEPLPEEIEDCLVLAVGLRRFNEINKGKATPTLEERQKGERCFGKSPHPLQKRPFYLVSKDIEECLLNAVGEMRFNEINQGESLPREEERKLGNACFNNINPVQTKILPPPPIQVPYVEEDTEVVKIESSDLDTEVIAPGIINRIYSLRGRSRPGSVVDIYIFSEPIVISTQADENGDWVYKLNEPLTGGSHIAYAVTRDESGKNIRSSVYNFEVLAAESGSDRLLEEGQSSQVSSKFFKYSIYFIAGALLIVLGAGIYAYKFIKTQNNNASSFLERNSEGKTGTGTVN